MGLRVNLHEDLVRILGTSNVYYQPPETIKMAYPCIVYQQDRISTRFANNRPYNHQFRYSVTFITKNVDASVVNQLLMYPRCSFDRHFTSDNLHHYVFNLYY